MNCFWLQKILDEATDLSKSDWSTNAYQKALDATTELQIGTDDDYFHEVLLSNFENEIESFEKLYLVKFFEFLHFSIIGGECFHTDFSDLIKKTITICGKFQFAEFNDEIDEEIQLSLENKIQELEPLSVLKKSLLEFQSSSNFLLRLIENPSLNTLFDLSDRTQDILDELKSNTSFIQNDLKKELLLSVKNNLILLRKDFCLKYDIQDIKTLLISKNELEICSKYFISTPTISKILELLIEKSIFLIRKLIIRKNKEDNVHNENYVFLGKESNFDLTAHKLKLEVFKDWDRYSKNHFLSEDNHEKTIILKRNAKKIIDIGKVCALDFHSLTKYYKDLNSNFSKLTKLLDEIQSIPIDSTSFDKFALDKIKNYISNNIFSETIKNISTESKVEIVENLIDCEIEKIEKIQDDSFLNNFFPYYKICDFLNKYIEIKITALSLDSQNSKFDILEIKRSHELLQKYFNIFKKYLKWSKVHLNYACQLPFKECIKKHKIDTIEINVFSSSTFSLPIEFEKYDDFERYTEAFLLRIDNEIKSLNNLDAFVSLFKKDRDKLQEEIRNNSNKNIELLGIFSAVIALLFQGVNTAQSLQTFEQKILTFIAMFIVLIAFLLLLHYFVNHRKNK
ncbi:hypothetical protein [Flavobacterium phragmitis]|uniref:Uncharacterized protein n=1 Tax=Flavobacterium phragmitis TaxID=739143 RepID=A0A1I1JWQ9_9FLAO|nr:hypothetical protein [Flavobacterium phragmitis]SFC52946.1 hypothetical protein SAMN05216297_101147 [Flavobacterium phragmitis]